LLKACKINTESVPIREKLRACLANTSVFEPVLSDEIAGTTCHGSSNQQRRKRAPFESRVDVGGAAGRCFCLSGWYLAFIWLRELLCFHHVRWPVHC
jgi:hypothetical protein